MAQRHKFTSKDPLSWRVTHLLRNLPEVVDEAYDGITLERVLYAVYVHVALVKEIVEDIVGVDGRLALLLVAEYEVDPLMQVRAHVVALEGLAVHPHKLPRIPLGPRGQPYVVQLHSALLLSCDSGQAVNSR